MSSEQQIKASTFSYNGLPLLEAATREIQGAEPENRMDVLWRKAYYLGGLVASGFLPEFAVIENLRNIVKLTSPEAFWNNAFTTIDSGIREGGRSPILPDALKSEVYLGKRCHEPAELVAQRIAVTTGGNASAILLAVEAIYNEPATKLLTFWDVDFDEKKKKSKLQLSRVKYQTYLEQQGFRRYRQGATWTIVRVQDNIVFQVYPDGVKKQVMGFLRSLPEFFDYIYRYQVEEQLLKEHRHFFDAKMLEFLPELPDNFVRDEKKQAFFYFLNGALRVTSEGQKMIPYRNLQGLVWQDHILQHNFHRCEGAELNRFSFYRFLSNITGKDTQRLLSLMTAMGYLLHGYKDPSNPKIIIFVDENISDNPSGGTGKGLICKTISLMRNTVQLDGKTFDFKEKFAFQEVTEATRLVVFEDWDGKRLPFDKLFNMATTMLKVNRLYQGQVTLPFERSPKFAITTNDMVGGEGDSHARRKFEIEIAPYYSANYTPYQEFKQNFFSDWDAAQWNIFNNLMIECCQLFLQKGLVKSPSINLNRRKLLQTTQLGNSSTGFAEFMDSKLKDRQGNWLEAEIVLIKPDLYDEFLKKEELKDTELSAKRFNSWLQVYASYEGIRADTNTYCNDVLGNTVRAVSFKCCSESVAGKDATK